MNKFDQVIVVDIEATCWEPREEQGDQPNEIIEVGVCRLYANPVPLIGDKNSFLVRPKYSKVSDFCTELTGHTWDTLKHGRQLGDVCNILFRKFGTKNRVWASWGDYDRNHFLKECRDKDVRYPFGPSHLNASALFSLMTGENKKFSVTSALNYIGKEFKGKQHRGDDDAYNIARILMYMLEKGKIAHVKRYKE